MDDTQSTVPVAISIEKRAEYADEFARLVSRLKGERDSAKEDARQHREEIEAIMDDLEKLADRVHAGLEEKSQLELFVGEDEARKGLAEVAKAVCSCAGEDVHSPTCPVHGVGSTEATAADVERREREHDAILAGEIAAVEQAAADNAGAIDQPADDVEDVIAKNTVDVGTVKEPAVVKQFKARGRVH